MSLSATVAETLLLRLDFVAAGEEVGNRIRSALIDGRFHGDPGILVADGDEGAWENRTEASNTLPTMEPVIFCACARPAMQTAKRIRKPLL